MDNIKDSAVSFSLEQLEPQLETLVDSNCESQSSDERIVSYCKEVGRDAIGCFIETGGDTTACVEQLKQQVCGQFSGSQRQQCLDQFNQANITIGE